MLSWYQPKVEHCRFFQVQSALDVGQNSAYSQLQTALKVRNENSTVSADSETQRPFTASWEPKSKRMLKLTVSDGHGTFAALEFEPISQLTYPATPGEFLPRKGLGIILVVLSVIVVGRDIA